MFWNNIYSSLRIFLKNRSYALFNITGLSVGFISATFILLYVVNELSYDKHNEKHERIYRLESDFTINNKHDNFAVTATPLGPALKLEFPEVENYVRFAREDRALITVGKKEFWEDNLYYADSTIFDVFTLQLISGQVKSALTYPNTIVLTRKLAEKYFGRTDIVNEVIQIGDHENFKITGIIDNLPDNTHLKFDGLISTNTLAKRIGAERLNSLEPTAFWNVGIFSYILLKPNASIETIHKKMAPFYKKYTEPVGKQINGGFKLVTRPLAEVHFCKNRGGDLPVGNMAYIYIFSVVAVFILLLAAINYMNMATARSATRAKEVGIRKVLGSFKNQLISQFLTESVLLSFISLIISILAVAMLLPFFNQLADKHITFSQFMQPSIAGILLIISIIVGLLSGSYPAFYLSSFSPVMVLKGRISKEAKGGWLRKALVVFQFAISIIMIIGTIIVFNQLNYLKNKDLGFEKRNQIVIQNQDTSFRKQIPVFKEELLQNPNIEKISAAWAVPGEGNSIVVMRVEKENKMQEYALYFVMVDYDYIDLFNLQLVKGRKFDKNMGTDLKEGVIINETAVKKLGWQDNPIGKKIDFGLNLDGTADRYTKVIGVVKDFHFWSLHNPIEPFGLFLTEQPANTIIVKAREGKTADALSHISRKWSEFGNNYPFDYRFLEKSLDEQYRAEQKLGTIFSLAAAICIIIAILGLLGLSSYTTERRTKEIGIRKVLGATVPNILKMLYTEFAILIVIAFAIAAPAAYFAGTDWLANFAYQVGMGWTLFLISGLVALLIGLTTISFHSIKASLSNPAESIKWE